MPKQPTIKKTISDAQLKNELIKLFEGGNTSKTNLYELIRTKYKIAKQRCLNMFDTAYLEWQKTKEQATKEQIQANAVEGLKIGLKSKLERQKELEDMLLPSYKVEESQLDFKTGKVIRYYRTLQPSEIAIIHRELSKMGGDYAPAKVAQTDVEGRDIVWNETKTYEANEKAN